MNPLNRLRIYSLAFTNRFYEVNYRDFPWCQSTTIFDAVPGSVRLWFLKPLEFSDRNTLECIHIGSLWVRLGNETFNFSTRNVNGRHLYDFSIVYRG